MKISLNKLVKILDFKANQQGKSTYTQISREKKEIKTQFYYTCES